VCACLSKRYEPLFCNRYKTHRLKSKEAAETRTKPGKSGRKVVLYFGPFLRRRPTLDGRAHVAVKARSAQSCSQGQPMTACWSLTAFYHTQVISFSLFFSLSNLLSPRFLFSDKQIVAFMFNCLPKSFRCFVCLARVLLTKPLARVLVRPLLLFFNNLVDRSDGSGRHGMAKHALPLAK
jgi:hypothetical protein